MKYYNDTASTDSLKTMASSVMPKDTLASASLHGDASATQSPTEREVYLESQEYGASSGSKGEWESIISSASRGYQRTL